MHSPQWTLPEELYTQKGYWLPYTLSQELERWATAYGDCTALVSGDSRLSYTMLSAEAEMYAAGFHSLGIAAGDRVLLQLPNVAELVLCLFGLSRIGAVPVLTMPASRDVDIVALCAKAEPVAYISATTFQGVDYRDIVRKLRATSPFLRHYISIDGGVPSSIPLHEIRMKGTVPAYGADYRDTALLLISGGTTGVPKLIPRRHTDYAYVARACAARCGMRSNSVYLAVLPAAHNFPLCCPGILGTLSLGGRVVLSPSPAPDTAFTLIEKECVTHTALVPALLGLWLEARRWEAADLSGLELIQVGGAPLSHALARRVEPELGCRLQQVFGTAEGLICMTHPDAPLETILATQGTEICPDDEVRFVDAHGEDVAAGEVGELIVRGPYTIQGYYNAPETNAVAVTSDGYYRTGDLARRLPDGSIQVTGRVKDQINRAGEKIAPVEVEEAIRRLPDIQDVVVVGVPDEELGERICAWIITESQTLSLKIVREALQRNGVALHKLPDQLKETSLWPLTTVGKIDRVALRLQSER